MIQNTSEVKFQLFKDEESLNGFYHLVQKKLHGVLTKHSYVGLKNYHIKEALDLDLPIMIHLCPEVELRGTSRQKSENLKKCNYKDQTEVMILEQKNFFKFRSNGMTESKSKNELGDIRQFTEQRYEVWHYTWRPNYIEGRGMMNNQLTPEDEGLGLI